jgi:hypothetical protein
MLHHSDSRSFSRWSQQSSRTSCQLRGPREHVVPSFSATIAEFRGAPFSLLLDHQAAVQGHDLAVITIFSLPGSASEHRKVLLLLIAASPSSGEAIDMPQRNARGLSS